jgi:hypothetical protein
VRRAVTVLSATAAALLLVSAPALAAPGKPAPKPHAVTHSVTHAGKPAPKKPVVRVIELNGIVSDTATATIPVVSDTATVTISDTPVTSITIKVKGGERSLHGKTVTLAVDGKTVVRRGARGATLASLRAGDRVSVLARRLADGRWYALRVNAAPRSGR